LPTDFLPSVDEGQFEIKYALPAGMSLDAQMRSQRKSSRRPGDPSVAHEARLSGVDTNGYLATPPDAGTIRVTLKPGAPPFDVVADRLRIAIENVNEYVALEVHQLLEDQINDLSGAPEPIQLVVRGPNQRVLTDIATRIADHISDCARRRRRIRRGHLRSAHDPSVPRPATLHLGSVRQRPASSHRRDRRNPGAHRGRFDSGRRALGGPHAARSRRAPRAASTRDAGGRGKRNARIVRVTAGIENADLSTVIARIRHQISYDLRHLPRGYSIEIGGAVEAQRAAFREFAVVLGAP
jgi:multidrug efflux pump subunit AcrB